MLEHEDGDDAWGSMYFLVSLPPVCEFARPVCFFRRALPRRRFQGQLGKLNSTSCSHVDTKSQWSADDFRGTSEEVLGKRNLCCQECPSKVILSGTAYFDLNNSLMVIHRNVEVFSYAITSVCHQCHYRRKEWKSSNTIKVINDPFVSVARPELTCWPGGKIINRRRMVGFGNITGVLRPHCYLLDPCA